jgi:hypothetical protein
MQEATRSTGIEPNGTIYLDSLCLPSSSGCESEVAGELDESDPIMVRAGYANLSICTLSDRGSIAHQCAVSPSDFHPGGDRTGTITIESSGGFTRSVEVVLGVNEFEIRSIVAVVTARKICPYLCPIDSSIFQSMPRSGTSISLTKSYTYNVSLSVETDRYESDRPDRVWFTRCIEPTRS